MNEELQKKLVEVIQGAQSARHEAFLFTKDQVPDVLHQLLIYSAISSTIYGLAIFALAGIFIWVALKIYRFSIKEKAPEVLSVVFFFGGCAAVIAFIGLYHFTTVLQIWLAPKVFLLEYAKGFIGK